MMTALIVAMTENRVIGKDNSMPWHMPEDLKLFKETTSGNIIAMGRKTYESIGRPLPNRENFVISRSSTSIEGCRVFKSVSDCIEAAKEYDKKLFFIGGGQIYSEVIDVVDELHLSFIKEEFDGDTVFPEIDFDKWKEIETKDFDGFTYIKYIRI
ncbi:MAG: dihydrofolate reductase [Denitrovibrio sp.]|nr:MAG: dihydrofolate reductase [Denitrovibrio sp.]